MQYLEDKKNIEKIQRRATKIIDGMQNLPYEERLRQLDLPSFEYRRTRGDLMQCFKLMEGLVRVDKCIFFDKIGHTKTRSYSERIRKKKAT